MTKLAVLVSGTGSFLEAMLDQGLPIDLVLADRPCRGITDEVIRGRATVVCVPRSSFGKGNDFARRAFTLAVIAELRKCDIGLVAMAGFMTIFDLVIFDYYRNAILNTHPSLLPAFNGNHAVEDALAYGVKVIGCTIHIATADLDTGAILAQEAVRVLEGGSVTENHERIKEVERVLYPRVIEEYRSRGFRAP